MYIYYICFTACLICYTCQGITNATCDVTSTCLDNEARNVPGDTFLKNLNENIVKRMYIFGDQKHVVYLFNVLETVRFEPKLMLNLHTML